MTFSLAEMLPPEMLECRWRPLLTFQIDVQKPSIVGKTPWCDRRVGEISGGLFEGKRLRGTLRTGGSDWQTVRPDGAWTLDVRFVMETDDAQLIGMTYRGIRHGPPDVMDRIARGESVSPADYYMRVVPFFETASEKYDWLNRVVSVAHGYRIPTGAIYQVFEVL